MGSIDTRPTTALARPHNINGDQEIEHASPALRDGRPTILHLGDPIQYNHDIYNRLDDQFKIIKPDPPDLERTAFIRHLQDRTWGDFSAIMRPFWRSGNAMHPWDRQLIELLPGSMKVMASAGAGYDWVKDRCLAEHGIVYCNGAGASTEAVADMALFLIISVFRQMTESSLAARSCSPKRWQAAHDQVPSKSRNPRGHTLGIIGLGNIGFAIAAKVKLALGMEILYNDVVRKTSDLEDQVGATYFEKMEEMLPNCDCVLIATPAGPPLLTATTLALLPRGARVVNIARGRLIDEDALADALDRGHVSAAGLDVQANEPKTNERLAQMANVHLTSHTGGGTVETNAAFEELSMLNCEAVLKERPPLTAVNTQWLKPKPAAARSATIYHSNGPPSHESHDEVKQVGNVHAQAYGDSDSFLSEPDRETEKLAPAKKIHDSDHTNGVT